MRKTLFISLGSASNSERHLLSFWWDYAVGSGRTRFNNKIGFDVDRWEAEQTHIFANKGATMRNAWKTAWRIARVTARSYDGYEVV